MAGKKKDSDKRMKAALNAGAAVMVSLSSFSFIQAVAATATLPIIAKVIHAIEVTINTSLDFGTIAATNEVAGLATIDPATNELRINGSSGLALAGGVPRAGRVQIKGAAMPVNVSMETNNVHLTNGSTFLTINNFNFITANGGDQVTITPTAPASPVVLSVGATMNTRPGQLTGSYVGSNRIFANYQ